MAKTIESKWQPMNPDTVMFNGNIITVDEDFSLAEAIAIKGDRIIGIGSNYDITKLAGENTKLVDLNGCTVLPGINDAHCHLNGFGLERPPIVVDLGFPTIKSIADMKAATATKVTEVGPGKWISGWGWDRGFLEELKGKPDVWPSRSDIDPVCPDNPVFYTDFSGHVNLVNSKALALAGIDKNTPDPEGGTIQRDENGEPTGILLEGASRLVRGLIPPLTEEDRKAGILNAMAELNSLGITCVTEPGLSPELIRIYTELFNQGKFTVRVNCMIMGGSSLEDVKRNLDGVGTSTGFGNEWLRISGYKLFADGIPPSKTAFMYEDYIGGGHGQLLVEGDTDEERYEMLVSMIKYANARNFQVGIHVTGDHGIDACVDGYLAALEEHPWDARHYIIHTDYVTPECIKRMAENDIGANVQSAIKWTIGNLMLGITGEKRAAWHWPLKSLFEAGVRVSNSSDASVTYPDWRQGVESAVLRKDKATGKVIGVDQCITVEQAIRSYTINGAWQDHQDYVRGSIEVGKLADFTIIGEDILKIDPNKIHEIPIVSTIVGGKTVYSNPDYDL
ncbi:MAG: amidohydrolase [Dehalococcoidales bacterium]|nr:amidohydrolase [Dehalococcoidales bacterium]